MMSSYLVMLQTNSNQPFIFSSPRLREQIGASFEITLLSKWVKDIAEELLDTKTLPRSFWVSDSSGKVIVRFTEADGDPKDLAKRLIREVTLRALTDAPGLDVTGVFIEATSNTVDADDLKELDHVFLEYSLNRRPAAARFPQFPFLERGSESALPASPKLSEDDCREMRHYARETHSKFPFSPTTTPIFRHLRRQTKTRRTPCPSPRVSSARGHGQLDAFSSRRLRHVGRQIILTNGRKQ